MSHNPRFSILQGRAVKDQRISDAQFRTLAALGTYTNEDGWCFPSLKTLGDDLGKSKQAVGKDIINLKNLGYVQVFPRYDEKGGRRSNRYRLLFDLLPRQLHVDTPSTLEIDTPSTSGVDVKVPIEGSHLTPENKKEILRNAEPAWSIVAGESISQEKLDYDRLANETISAFESAFSIKGNWNWFPAKPQETRVWAEFRAFLIKLYQADKDCFTKYFTWAHQPYSRGAMTGGKIKSNPQDFPDAWAAFCASAMYTKPRQVVPDSERTDLDASGAPMSY